MSQATPKQNPPPAIIWVSPSEFRRHFGISKGKTHQMIAGGELEVRRFGPRTIRIAVQASDFHGSQS